VHRKRRRVGVLLAILLGVPGVAAFFAGLVVAGAGGRNYTATGMWIVFGGLVLAALSAAAYTVYARVLIVRRIDHRHAWYTGAGEPFLTTLGTTPGPWRG
jgi:hypothetical protein